MCRIGGKSCEGEGPYSIGRWRQVSAELIENLDPGDYVMVHAGTAIAKISSDDIEETTELLEDL